MCSTVTSDAVMHFRYRVFFGSNVRFCHHCRAKNSNIWSTNNSKECNLQPGPTTCSLHSGLNRFNLKIEMVARAAFTLLTLYLHPTWLWVNSFEMVYASKCRSCLQPQTSLRFQVQHLTDVFSSGSCLQITLSEIIHHLCCSVFVDRQRKCGNEIQNFVRMSRLCVTVEAETFQSAILTRKRAQVGYFDLLREDEELCWAFFVTLHESGRTCKSQ